MKRFWKQTRVVAVDEAFCVQLDGRPVKLPSGAVLSVPLQALAEAIAAEWAAAGEVFTPDDLPLTQLATTAQDRVRRMRIGMIEQLAGYGMNDLLCYRAVDPPALARREAEEWQPWIDWVDRQLGISLKSAPGIMHIEQPAACREGFVAALNGMDDDQLAGLGVIVPALGSLVLGLAVAAGALAPLDACACANLGELWQEARWGADDEAIARRAAVAKDVAASARFMFLCRP